MFGAREKFNQNQELKNILLATNNTKMVEASKDLLWGIGLLEFEAKNVPEEKWKGSNLLGKVLDKLKVEFKNENIKKLKI